jgi:hypothetical protein
MTLKHAFVNPKADGGDATITRPSDWNADHIIDETGMLLNADSNAGTSAAANKMRLRARKFAERIVPEINGPAGAGYALQAALWESSIIYWSPTTATAGVWQGSTGGTTNGTYSNIAPTWTDRMTAQKRSRYSNAATTTNQVLGQRNTEALWALSSNASVGGFFYFARGGFATWTNGGRFFAGLNSGTNTTTACPVIASDPSTVGHSAGFGVDAADNGLISFFTRNGTTNTKASTGMTIVSNKSYDFFIYAPAAQTTNVYWFIFDHLAQTTAGGTATATLPAANTGLMANFSASNAALTTVNQVQVEVGRIYIEADF